MPNAENLWNFAHWIATVIVEHDAANKWLTLMPNDVQQAMYEVGNALVGWLGG